MFLLLRWFGQLRDFGPILIRLFLHGYRIVPHKAGANWLSKQVQPAVYDQPILWIGAHLEALSNRCSAPVFVLWQISIGLKFKQFKMLHGCEAVYSAIPLLLKCWIAISGTFVCKVSDRIVAADRHT